jgi:S1-C subfamily serine protease
LSPEERINVAVYEKVNKSVVHMTTKGVRADAVLMFDMAVEGAGSGSILDKAGHILTNYHVIEDARQVSVTLYDGKSYDARFVGADPVNDVCVIRIDAPSESLFPVTFGDSGKLKVGMRVFAIGNPFGLERTLTTGIISSLNRSLQIHNNRSIKSIIQIDAAINPGNSGGPLLDTHARLIGMNTAIASRTGQNSGVGFAIPVSLIARIVPQLIERGQVIRPEIGIARVFETERGLLIAKITPGGPAERAGLRGPAVQTRKRGPFVVESVDRSAADLIVAVDGEPVRTADDFLSHIEARRAGDTVTLTILRQGREMQVRVQLVSSVEPPAPRPR